MTSKRTYAEEDLQNSDDTNLQTFAKRGRREATLTVTAPELRKLFEEYIPPILQRHWPPCCRCCHNHQGGSSGSKDLQLCFVNGLPQVIFTMGYLTAEGGGSLEIELRYSASQQRVDKEELSTLKAQIYLLDGDFENEDWTAEEFDRKIVKPREGKGPLLKGKTDTKIEKGVGFINNRMVTVTDNSASTRTRTFRLGVRIVGSNSSGARIREAISEPFRVKDKRGKSTIKHEVPSLNDDVWRLKHIGRTGELRKQLSQKGIKTVKDLLRLNTMGSLREKFGKTNNTWDKIIEHAKDCELDDYERYSYRCRAGEQDTSVSLVFNCIYELEEVIFNEQHRSLQSLNREEKRFVENIKLEAYSNPQKMELIETPTRDIVTMLTDTQVTSSSAPYQGLQLPGQSETWTGIFPSFVDDPLWILADQWEQPNLLSFGGGDDGASYSQYNHSFLLNTAGYMSTKTVWKKVRNAFKCVFRLHMAKMRSELN
ncbi:hypothetical protein PHAVU_001G226100 [Phaseolus vulgaris]|uniref:Calmodulin-binding protein n=1 Tax=Phaseolus vulgaris TaxID=3885 RepID=V7D0Z8_PHAVU|nr:hypothetical protein PHAVU_001G226100g [Phaseolus vulgaris]ESW35328.1 hypothetical protein PHAVU_001G226100g [Phaseolus vulgaris]